MLYAKTMMFVFLTKLEDYGIQPSMYTYNILIYGLCKVGRVKDAWKVFEYLLLKGYNLDAYTYTIIYGPWVLYQGLVW